MTTPANNSVLSEPVPERARALCRRFGVRQLDVFGSVLTDRFDPERSDVDLRVTFESDGDGQTLHGYPYRRRSIDAARQQIVPAP